MDLGRGRSQPSGASIHSRTSIGSREGAPRPQPQPQFMRGAEMFDDEKRRIIESCFSKFDDKGAPLQSYITHVRVEEDANFQMSPPPPDASPEAKKPRVVIIGVKPSGRVWMHKARENIDRTFQIGKSWPLEDLQAIESFTNLMPKDVAYQQRCSWAGPTGFVITMAKPYYWQATTQREKQYFIDSLVKIYFKFTAGKLPKLIGFDVAEEERMRAATASSGGSTSSRGPSQTHSDMGQGRAVQRSSQPQAQTVPVANINNASNISDMNSSRPITASSTQQDPRPSQSPADGSQARQRFQQPLQPLHNPPPQQPQFVYNSPSRSNVTRDHTQMLMPSQERDDLTRIQAPSADSMYMHSSPSNANNNNGVMTPQTQSQQTVLAGPSKYAPNAAPLKAAMNEVRRGPISQAPAAGTYMSGTSQARRSRLEDSPVSSIAPAMSFPLDAAGRTFSFSDESISSGANPQLVPERRRPPMPETASNDNLRSEIHGARVEDDQQVIRPLALKIPGNRTSAPQQTANSSIVSSLSELNNTNGTKAPASDSTSITERTSQIADRASTASSRVEDDPPISAAAAGGALASQEPRFRPGLGPMTGKASSSELAGKFRKATAAHTAFKPRAGGAGERLLGIKSKPAEGPDGITGVVPAPSLARAGSHGVVKPLQPSQMSAVSTPDVEPEKDPMGETTGLAQDQVSRAVSKRQPPEPELARIDTPLSNPETPADSPRTQQSGTMASGQAEDVLESPSTTSRLSGTYSKRGPIKYMKGLVALGIDPSIFGGQELKFANVLDEIGWEDNTQQIKNAEALENSLRLDIGRLEAGSWLDHTGEKDERVELVKSMLDRAISECEELEGLFTLYSVELGTLNDDIAYIEAQQQGLQVQAANQKLLHTELQQLVDTVNVTDAQLDPLRYNSFDDSFHLERIESCLLVLSNALFRIDPTIKQYGIRNLATSYDAGTFEMRAFEEKKTNYVQHTVRFLDRLEQHMNATFTKALVRAAGGHSRSGSLRSVTAASQPLTTHDLARQSLWKYSPLMLYTKQMEVGHWNSLLKRYQEKAHSAYAEEVRSNVSSWKATARNPSKEEADALFTNQEKETDGPVSRKLGVKRAQTVGKGPRSVSSEKRNAYIKGQESKLYPAESVAGALDEILPLISSEQNFVVDFFHATTLENFDFADALSSVPPAERLGTALSTRRAVEPDRAMAKKVADVIGGIFNSLLAELQHLVDWAISNDPFQGIGVLFALERQRREVANSSQEFIFRMLQHLSEHVSTRFIRFVDEQIRAIEDTKVKIKKRKGVIGFIRVFPNFSTMIENIAQSADSPECLDTRAIVDVAYNKVNKAMFDSLKFIAKEGPSSAPSSGLHAPRLGVSATEAEDKEALNHHILLIENMYYYYSEVDERGVVVLGQWRGKAMLEMSEHQDQYVKAVLRRPIGRLLDFLDGLDAHLAVSPGREHPSGIPAAHASHSRSVFKKIVAANDAKEVRRGIDTLRRRVEKHFAEADAPAKLMAVVLDECERKYVDAHARLERAAARVYEGSVELEFGRQDVTQAFRR